jgi:ribonuclease-3
LIANLAYLSDALGYRFRNPDLLEEALTHRSAGVPHNERLEYLGDAMLNAIIAGELYRRFPKASEGELSRLRASLVREETLAAIARELGLGEYLRLGPGELKSGGSRRASILADALEALFGAVYLDGGYSACQERVLALLRKRMESGVVIGLKDPKTRLQEFLQAQRMPLPAYQVLEVSGEAHAQSFRVECKVPGLAGSTLGEGNSRRRAEQAAASKALELLGCD